MLVVEYMNKFEKLKIRSREIKDPLQTLAQFKLGLRAEIRSQMITQKTRTINEAFQLAFRD